MRIIFLDIDGVLNCQIFYEKRHKGEYPIDLELCPERMDWFNHLCKETKAKVVISSTWRKDGIEEVTDTLRKGGATFEIIGVTPVLPSFCVRGNEILEWMKTNKSLLGCSVSDYKNYVILDDDSDMLYWQRNNFFLIDGYSGLTPNVCYKIKRFFGGK